VTRLARTLVLALLLLLAACSKSYRVGDRVLVDWEGADYPASVVVVEGPGRYKVHYEGYEAIWDESVPATRIKGKVHGAVQVPPPPAKVRARMAAGNKASLSTFKVGDRVKVDWKGSFYPATVLLVLGNERYRVHYDGYDQNWDENVDISRIQRKLGEAAGGGLPPEAFSSQPSALSQQAEALRARRRLGR